ncbi:hypothetical protein ACM66B_003950 [Microbotryomycetes sp. NB124-2]
MGWFGGSSGDDKQSSGGDSSVPDRRQREQCWHARDEFFKCLDANDTKVPGQQAAGVCASEDSNYKKHCAASWVDYFNKRRVLQIRQDMMEQRAREQQQQK